MTTAADFRHAYKKVRLAELKASEGNAMTHPPEQIAQLRASIREFGFTQPVLVDPENNIIAGHGRREAAMLEGLEEVPAIELQGLTEAQKRALGLADNQLGRTGVWDEDLLKLAIGKLHDQDAHLVELVGFTDRELCRLLDLTPGGRASADDVPEPKKHAISHAGDLWLLGQHRVLCGDSFEPDDVDRLLGTRDGAPVLANLVVTDPPYAIYGSSTGIAADIADDKMVRPFFEKLGRTLADRTVEFGHIYVHCDWRSYATLWHGLKSAQLSPKNCVVWDKGSAGLGNSYANTHEFVAFFARLPKQKAMTSGNKRGQRPVHKANIFRTNRVTGEERQHNAAKPVDLLGFLIQNSSEEGDTVLDLFGGSGSTLIACQQENRVCHMMEMEPRFVDVIVERFQRFTGTTPVLEGANITWETVKEERSAKTARAS